MLRFQYRGRSGRTDRIGMRNGHFNDEDSGHFEAGSCGPVYRGLGFQVNSSDIPRQKYLRDCTYLSILLEKFPILFRISFC